jgi:hypothetical protein
MWYVGNKMTGTFFGRLMVLTNVCWEVEVLMEVTGHDILLRTVLWFKFSLIGSLI